MGAEPGGAGPEEEGLGARSKEGGEGPNEGESLGCRTNRHQERGLPLKRGVTCDQSQQAEMQSLPSQGGIRAVERQPQSESAPEGLDLARHNRIRSPERGTLGPLPGGGGIQGRSRRISRSLKKATWSEDKAEVSQGQRTGTGRGGG